MSKFIEGQDRSQGTLFPERLDDYVEEDSPVRVIDVFIDDLDISGLGFRTELAATGRPRYHPKTMLKLYVYGYLNQVQTSRRLEREAQRNVELMWLTGRLAPDFKTIADFRKDNPEAIRLVCREFVMLCKKLNLLSEKLVAIDGSKFKAVNSRDRNFTKAKMKRRLKDVASAIERYLAQLDETDQTEPPPDDAKTLQDKVAKLREEMARLKKLEVRMLEAPDQQLSLTDPDARSMNSRGTGVVGYNVQSAVDAKHHLIIAHEVSKVGNDRRQLAKMAKQAKAILDTKKLTVVADKGYYNGHEIRECEQNDIVAYVAKPKTSGNRARGQFDRSRFTYIKDDDQYECPAGERLMFRFERKEAGKQIRRYWSSACPACPIKAQCTTGDNRYLPLVVYDLDGPSSPPPALLCHVDLVGHVESIQRLRRSRVRSKLAELYGYLRHTVKFIAVRPSDGLTRGSTVNQALLNVVGFGAGSQQIFGCIIRGLLSSMHGWIGPSGKREQQDYYDCQWFH
ncbi:MAG TPA: IS1182 family transposase [Woeseiaceae bacterium]|nr:IS1182 family transposase [Woeseiaceae bacterium]